MLRKINTPSKVYKRILEDSKNYLYNIFFTDKSIEQKIHPKCLDERLLKFIGKKRGDLVIYSCIKNYYGSARYPSKEWDLYEELLKKHYPKPKKKSKIQKVKKSFFSWIKNIFKLKKDL
jgi:hypothetical protein